MSVEPLSARGSLQPTGWGTGSDYRSRTNLNVRVLDFIKSGGAEGIRTPDPLLAKQVLSRLSYSPRMA